MRVVDWGDLLETYYIIDRRSKKWWKRVFCYLIECAVLNSFVLEQCVWPAEFVCHGRGK